MEEAEFERAVAAFESEGPARCPSVPERFIDQEILAIESLQALDTAFREVGEHPLIKRPRTVAAMRRTEGPADDIMFGIRSECCQHALDVIARFEAEMRVDFLVHFQRSQHVNLTLSEGLLMRRKSQVNTKIS